MNIRVDSDDLRTLCGELAQLKTQRGELQAAMSSMVLRRQRLRADLDRIRDAVLDGYMTPEHAITEMRDIVLAAINAEVLGHVEKEQAPQATPEEPNHEPLR